MASLKKEDQAPPALFDHCVRAYNAMLSESRAIQGANEHIIVYEGFLTRLFAHELHLSVPYYTSVRQTLVNMGCIRQLRRGGGSSPSQWEMVYEPTVEAFEKAVPKKQPKQTRESQTIEQIQTLSSRLGALEDTVNEIVLTLAKLLGATPASPEEEE